MISQPRILIVEDGTFERYSLSSMLRKEGYFVTAVADGPAALDQLQDKEFDIVISDSLMPQMTGIELLKEIRHRHASIAVIIMTAYGTLRDAVEAIKAGAYDFLEKNHSMDKELKLSVKRALAMETEKCK